MNQFIKGLLNMPSENITNILKFDNNMDMILDKYIISIQVFKEVYNIDIESIVNEGLSKLSRKSQTPLLDSIIWSIQAIDNELFKTHLDELKYLDIIDEDYIEEISAFDSIEDILGKAEYLLFNVFQIIVSLNFSYKLSFSNLDKRFNDFFNNTNVGKESLLNHNKNKYNSNPLSYLFYSDSLYSTKDKYTGLRMLLKSDDDPIIDPDSYFEYTEDFEEILVSSALLAAQNLFNYKFIDPDNNSKYTVEKFNTFVEEYRASLKYIHSQYLNNDELYLPIIDEINDADEIVDEKAELIKKHSEFSSSATKYISEIIYAFDMVTRYTELIYNDKTLLDSDYMLMFAELIRIPNLQRRIKYMDILAGQIKSKDIEKVKDYIRFEANVYYPLLVLTTIEVIRQMSAKNNITPTEFFLSNVDKDYNFIIDNKGSYVYKRGINKSLKRNSNINNALSIYNTITNNFYNSDKSHVNNTLSSYKITNHKFSINEIYKYVLNH